VVAASATPPPVNDLVVSSCKGMNGVDENCVVSLNAEACVESQCSKLLLLFSGGEMECVDPDASEGKGGRGWSEAIANHRLERSTIANPTHHYN
jgi:hypothetical protein